MDNSQLIRSNQETSYQNMVVYRSIYILKKKFEKYKSAIINIYQKHCLKNESHFKNSQIVRDPMIPIDSFDMLYKEVSEEIGINLMMINKPNELFVSNYIQSDEKKKKLLTVQYQLASYVKKNFGKYNQIYNLNKAKKANKDGASNNQTYEYNQPNYQQDSQRQNEAEEEQGNNNEDEHQVNEGEEEQQDNDGEEEQINDDNGEEEQVNNDEEQQVNNEEEQEQVNDGEEQVNNDNQEEEQVNNDEEQQGNNEEEQEQANDGDEEQVNNDNEEQQGNDNEEEQQKNDNEKEQQDNDNDNEEEQQDNDNNQPFDYYKPMVQYNKNGKVIKTHKRLKKENEESSLKIVGSIDLYQNELNHEREQTCIYVETLPVILADFIQLNPKVALTDTNDELPDIAAIFDKDIIVKLEEDAKVFQMQTHNLPNPNTDLMNVMNQKSTLIKTITLYENLLQEKKNKGDNTLFIQDMLDKLLAQKVVLEHKILAFEKKENELEWKKNASKLIHSQSQYISVKTASNIYTKNEKRERALRDIFTFYSKQHNLIGVTPLFQSIENKKNHIDMAEFSKFCTDFGIALTKEKYVELFKKNTSDLRNMCFEEFSSILKKIAITLNDSRKNYLWKKIDKSKEGITLMEQKEQERIEQSRMEYGLSDNTKKKGIINKETFNYNKAHKKCLEELSSLRYEYEIYSKKTYEQIYEEFYVYLCIDKESDYKKKLKGYLLPFHVQDKSFRIPNKILNKRVPENNKNLVTILAKTKNEKEKILQAKDLLKKDHLFKLKKERLDLQYIKLKQHMTIKLDKMHDNYQSMIQRTKAAVKETIEINTSIQKHPLDNKIKICWEKLGEMNLEDLEIADNEQNKELFCETNNSDEMELLNNLNKKAKQIDESKYNQSIDYQSYNDISQHSQMNIKGNQMKNSLPKIVKSSSQVYIPKTGISNNEYRPILRQSSNENSKKEIRIVKSQMNEPKVLQKQTIVLPQVHIKNTNPLQNSHLKGNNYSNMRYNNQAQKNDTSILRYKQ